MSNHPLGLSIPPVAEEVFRDIERSFPRLVPEPNHTTMDEVMYNAGIQALKEWLETRYRRKSIVTGG